MSIVDYDKKRLIRNLVDNPLFDALIEDIRAELAKKMLECDNDKARGELYYENKALTQIVGRLIAVANELRMNDAA
jgi:hypothetical protein